MSCRALPWPALLLWAVAAGAAAQPQFPLGRYAAWLDAQHWALEFDADAVVVVSLEGRAVVRGRYEVEGAEVEFSQESGVLACKGDRAVGLYGWSVKHMVLQFERIDDTCPGRIRVLTSARWRLLRGPRGTLVRQTVHPVLPKMVTADVPRGTLRETDNGSQASSLSRSAKHTPNLPG